MATNIETGPRAADRRIMSIPDGIACLTALFQFCKELMRLEAAWLAGVPYWDAKLTIGRHLLEDARHAAAMLRRLHELKSPSAETKDVPGLEEIIGHVGSAASGDEWLHGLYSVAKPWLLEQARIYLAKSDPLMDAPTHDVLRRLIEDGERQVEWFDTFKPGFSAWEQPDVSAWTDWLCGLLETVRIENGRLVLPVTHARRPGDHPDFAGIASVRRDRTFKTIGQRSAVPREGKNFAEQRFLVFYNHSQEMQFAESLGAIMWESGAMPWAFHFDLARHLADEIRHAHMGQARMEQLGHRLQDAPMMTQHYEFRSRLNPLERFCLMTLVMEATAFERKRANVELFEANGDEISARYESYDIRDEMQHTNLGHAWVPIMLRVYQDARSVAQVTEHCRAMIAQVISEYPTNAANMIKKSGAIRSDGPPASESS